MNKLTLVAAMAALALAACGQNQSTEQNSSAVAGQIFSGTGKVTAIAGDKVTISHGPIQGIGWPAMTMTFTAPTPVAKGVVVGDPVSFSFRQEGSAYVLTSLAKQ